MVRCCNKAILADHGTKRTIRKCGITYSLSVCNLNLSEVLVADSTGNCYTKKWPPISFIRTIYPDKKVAEAASTAFCRHLWYLSEVLVGFSFFDDEVPTDEKRLMVTVLTESNVADKPLKHILPVKDSEKKRLHDFDTTSTRQFFTLLDLPLDFLSSDPDQ